jgi:hypothetical protein
MFDDIIKPKKKDSGWIKSIDGVCIYCWPDEPLVFEDCKFHKPDCRSLCFYLVSYDGISVTQCSKHVA